MTSKNRKQQHRWHGSSSSPQIAQRDFWPEMSNVGMAFYARLAGSALTHTAVAASTSTKCPGACPQRSEDSRPGTSRRLSPPSNTGMNK